VTAVTEHPVIPLPAATIMLVRDEPAGMQVLMLRRNFDSAWVGGAELFPGGAVDLEDGDPALAARSTRDDKTASHLLNLDRGGLDYFVAAIRECFEEAGILLATRADGAPIDFDDAETSSRFGEARQRLNAGELGFTEFCATEDLRLDTDRLYYFSHWITPEWSTRRYDTRFFVAELPSGQHALHDDVEVIASTWIEPAEALERHQAGEIDVLYPTEQNLQAISRFSRSAELLAATRAVELPTILPKVVVANHAVRILLPGDDDYEALTGS
jgi:8-oxo-dGTP pyrophosphatase MutT (NUDIX family)